MKANELRLGNWIKTALSKDRGKPYQVVALRDNEVSTDKAEFQFNPIWTNLHYIKPIKLSEEWLLKFGFEFYEYELDSLDDDFNEKDDFDIYKSYKIYKNENTYFIVTLNPDGNNEFCIKFRWAEEGVLSNITYVHQLQNLYFALMGKELEIQKLEKNES